jgi:hypothetical protein
MEFTMEDAERIARGFTSSYNALGQDDSIIWKNIFDVLVQELHIQDPGAESAKNRITLTCMEHIKKAGRIYLAERGFRDRALTFCREDWEYFHKRDKKNLKEFAKFIYYFTI